MVLHRDDSLQLLKLVSLSLRYCNLYIYTDNDCNQSCVGPKLLNQLCSGGCSKSDIVLLHCPVIYPSTSVFVAFTSVKLFRHQVAAIHIVCVPYHIFI